MSDNEEDYYANNDADGGGGAYVAPVDTGSYYSSGTVSGSATTTIHADGGHVCCNLL
jgi:hypothetical protein